MANSNYVPKGRVSAGDCTSARSRTSSSISKTRSSVRTAYAACWCDDYDSSFGVYKVFASRGQCLDFLTAMVFMRAETLCVKVVDQGAKPYLDGDGELVFPEMTREQVRDRLGGGMDFSLVLRTSRLFDELDVDEQVTMGIREVEIE